MSYIGNKPATAFETVQKQISTSNSGTTITLDRAVTSVQDILVTIDAVVQSYDNYSVSGTTLTVGGTLSNNRVEILYVGRTMQTVSPDTGTVTLDMLSASGTKDATTFLRGDNTFATVSGTTINNNADNRVITGSGSANTLEGESNLTYDGTTFLLSQATPIFKILPTTNGNDGVVEICGRSSDGSPTENRTQIKGEAEGSTANTKMTFHVENSSGVNERMSINSGGDVKINTRLFIDGDFDTSSTTFKLKAEFGGSSSEAGISINDKDGATNNPHFVQFRRQNTIIGSISRNGSNDSVNYNTSSDYRLKDGIVDKIDGIEKLKQLKPRKFYWKSNTDKTLVDGFLAHEVSDIVPEAISGTKDAVDEDDNIIPQAIDQSKLVPLLTAALQEAITKIETLETRIQTLENE